MEAKSLISPAPAMRRLLSLVPLGGSLPENAWRNRHRFLVGLTWFHALIIALVGPALGYSWEWSLGALYRDGTVAHTVMEGLIVALFAALATRGVGRAFQATMIGFGLMSSSAILVHLSGGYIEFHFHFFVMLAFLALYQDWIPYSLAIVYVLIHHGVVGVLWPEEVYNHTAAFNAPWTWAGIHAAFVLCASVGSMTAWRFNEKAFAQTQRILQSAGEGIHGLDRDGKVTFMNPAASEMLGADARYAVGKHMHEIVRHTTAEGASFAGGESPILEPLKDGLARRGTDQIFQRMDGRNFFVDYLSTPIVERGELTGVVVTFTDVTERKRAEEQLQRHRDRQAALHDINLAITSTLDLKSVLRLLLEKIDPIVPYPVVTVVRLLNKRTGELETVASRNLDEGEWGGERWRSGRGLAYLVLEPRTPMVIRNLHTNPGVQEPDFYRTRGLVSYLGVPLIAKGEILGVLGLYTRQEHEFSKEETAFFTTLAQQASIAIHNSRLFEQAKPKGE
ncbi:MAG: GAF domain-containing protein [Deltaproteobacteria bacterium]|nr:GAF domain-containing protein [Deltaproteobacteria bacterium]MBI2209252.1 GAF domain-containing protein [Deltaproteobacteria bacterium]MBI2348588.1 GAF domain-containing protein [Deltaproteobacteria bacterium]MBI2540749.1 GAF domain-containing protein [Deltaproteobacteria bacterium]MBI2991309.1 GAF domain-containing protein [Deltaproteobacteria bacterium]